MEDTTKYTLEGAGSFFIMILAWRLYKLKCKTHSDCCDDNIQLDLENQGGELKK
tara:strand:- start:329 stop:490 length:162 start_codon:yes stop_codon:yes gene_type:complete